MTKIRLLSTLILPTILLAACASARQPAATSFPALPPSTPTTAAGPAESPIPSPVPVATSRGPELHATNPSAVSLASGGLQLVEFFRFT